MKKIQLEKYYYLLKKIIPRSTQISIRRKMIQWKMFQYSTVWPIDEKSAKPPENWQGWPEGKKFAFVITHDVETARGLNNCSLLMDMEEKYGFRSSFNFVPGDYTVPEELRRNLTERGFEVGIHGLYHQNNPFSSESVFRKQSIEINRYLKDFDSVGFRSPSMYHDLELLHHLNIEYDASTFDTDPFEPQPDGVSTIFPFRVSGNSNQKGYIELPYTLPQDFLLFILMQEKNTDIWKAKLDWIVKHGGMALFITHPDYMNFNNKSLHHDEYPSQYYAEFLDYIKVKYEGQYWNPLPKQIAHFWKDHYSYETVKIRKKLRICMLAYSFYESDGRIRRYAETLAKRGDQVDAIALRKEGQPDHEVIEGVHVYRIQKRLIDEKGEVSYLLKLIKFFILSLANITKRHINNPYDCIHVHSVPDFEVYATLFPKLLGAKIILDIHDIVPEFYASKFNKTSKSLLFKALAVLEKASIAFSDHVIISNHIWGKKLLSRSVSNEKCSVVMNYPDDAIFYRRDRVRNDDKFVMIYPGTLGWHQGLDIAIAAFAKIKDQAPEAEFHIYGRGPEKMNLKNLITELNLERKVFIKDTMPIDKIANVMANADLGLIPKRNDPFGGEAFSTKILEFMSLGVPIIVSETKIDKFYFNDTVLKFFKPDDIDDLAQCMLLLRKDKALRDRLVENAFMFVDNYCWKKKKCEYFELVDALTKNREI